MPDGAQRSLRVRDRGGQVEIFVHGDILPGMAEGYARELNAAGARPVLVRLHSGGGDWLEASAMFATTQAHRGSTTALVEGLAASSASFLLQAFTKRMIARNALLMVHGPTLSAHGTAADHEAAARLLNVVQRRLAGAYARSSQPSDVIDGWLAGEAWFDAGEALAAGLVDAIDEPARVAASLDLSRFTNVPQRVLAALGRGPTAQAVLMETSQMETALVTPEGSTPEVIANASRKEDLAAVQSAFLSAEQLGFGAATVVDMIASGVAAAAVPSLLIEAHANRQAEASSVQRIFPSGGIRIVRDERETLAGRIVDALHSRLTGREPSERAREFRGMRLQDIAERVGASAGRQGWFSPQAAAGLHTTSDLPSMLGAAGQRSLLDFYQVQASPMVQLSRRNDAADFRPRDRVRLGEAPQLLEVKEHGEVTSGAAGEGSETIQLATFARIFGLSRHAIINDDLGAFSDQLRWWAGAAAGLEASRWVACLSQTMSDGVAMFHANHGNLAGSGAAISVATLGTGRAAMRVQKGIGGVEIVGAPPKFLLCGAATETTAEAVIAPLSPAVVEEANPFASRLTVLCEPRISGNAWYLFADPAVMPTIEHAYLSRQPGPMLEVREGFEVLGTEYRLVLDFASAAIDWRGAYKNPGA